MKKLFRPFLIVAVAASLFAVSSCTKTCDDGFEGDNCKTEVRAKYLGTYNGTETCSGGSSSVTIDLLTLGDVVKVNIKNLYDANFVTEGTVLSDGTINIANQSFGSGTISGTAKIEAGKIKITYTVTAGGTADGCTWTQN